MKISFGEFKLWHDTSWPIGYIWSGDTALPDGRDIYAEQGGFNAAICDDELIDLSFWEGLEKDTSSLQDRDEQDVSTLIRRWRKARDFVAVVVTVPKGEEARLRAFVKGLKDSMQ